MGGLGRGWHGPTNGCQPRPSPRLQSSTATSELRLRRARRRSGRRAEARGVSPALWHLEREDKPLIIAERQRSCNDPATKVEQEPTLPHKRNV